MRCQGIAGFAALLPHGTTGGTRGAQAMMLAGGPMANLLTAAVCLVAASLLDGSPRIEGLLMGIGAGALVLGAAPALAGDKSMDQAVSEARLEGQIGTAILLNRHLNPFEISVDVEGDTAILTGTVDESIDKELAERVAHNAKGIAKVDNRITVDAAAKQRERGVDNDRDFDEAIEDASITASVKSRLLWNDTTDGLDIEVDTMNGRVTLSGDATTQAEQDKAHASWVRSSSTILKEAVLEIPGVKSVKGIGQVLIREALELGKWGPGHVEGTKMWQFADNGAPTADDRKGDPKYEQFSFEVTHSVIQQMLHDPKSGLDIDDIAKADSRLVVENPVSGTYTLRSAEDLLDANMEPTEPGHSGNLNFRTANTALQGLFGKELADAYQNYIDAFTAQRGK